MFTFSGLQRSFFCSCLVFMIHINFYHLLLTSREVKRWRKKAQFPDSFATTARETKTASHAGQHHRCTRVENPGGRVSQVFAKISGVKAFRKNCLRDPPILGLIAFLTSPFKFAWGVLCLPSPPSPLTPPPCASMSGQPSASVPATSTFRTTAPTLSRPAKLQRISRPRSKPFSYERKYFT